jgi:hypothetical protein
MSVAATVVPQAHPKSQPFATLRIRTITRIRFIRWMILVGCGYGMIPMEIELGRFLLIDWSLQILHQG